MSSTSSGAKAGRLGWCPDCGKPITRGPSGLEYGHRRWGPRCPRRPEEVDPPIEGRHPLVREVQDDVEQRGPSALEATGPREFICEKCQWRCTRGTDGREYGHRRRPRCPDRPRNVDPRP